MSRTDYHLVVFLGVIAAMLCIPLPSYSQAAPTQPQSPVLYVEISQAKLRAQPKHWSPGKVDLPYGSAVTEISRSSGWIKVKTEQGAEGFLHESAVTNRKVILSSTTGSTVQLKPDESDVVLAGKGFSRELEGGVAATHKQYNYSQVDRIEKYVVNEREMAKFIVKGKLNTSVVDSSLQ